MTNLSTCAKKSLLRLFCNNFMCMVLSSYISVLVTTLLLFHKIFAMIIFLSQSLFLHGSIDWIFNNIPARNRGVRKVRVLKQWGS